jgi:hypothetical protein
MALVGGGRALSGEAWWKDIGDMPSKGTLGPCTPPFSLLLPGNKMSGFVLPHTHHVLLP